MSDKGTMVEFGDKSRGYLALPEGGKGPAVLVLQEWWGLVDHIKDITDRFATAGYVALAPDLYHGRTTTDPEVAGKEMMGLDIEGAAGDLKAAVDYVLGREDVTGAKVGVAGFCMGGQLALLAAGQHEGLGAVVNFYGVHPDIAPNFGAMACSVLCHFGKTDGFVSVEDAKAVVASLEAAKVPVEAQFYEAGHAFFNDARPEAYVKEAATSAWQRTLTFLNEKLASA